jgi:hypothetical protein
VLLISVVSAEFATALPERTLADGKLVERTRVRITDAGRRALADQGVATKFSYGEYQGVHSRQHDSRAMPIRGDHLPISIWVILPASCGAPVSCNGSDRMSETAPCCWIAAA